MQMVVQIQSDSLLFQYKGTNRRTWSWDEKQRIIKAIYAGRSGKEVTISQISKHNNWVKIDCDGDSYICEIQCCSYTTEAKYPFFACSGKTYDSIKNGTEIDGMTLYGIFVIFRDENNNYWYKAYRRENITTVWKKQSESTRYRNTFSSQWQAADKNDNKGLIKVEITEQKAI